MIKGSSTWTYQVLQAVRTPVRDVHVVRDSGPLQSPIGGLPGIVEAGIRGQSRVAQADCASHVMVWLWITARSPATASHGHDAAVPLLCPWQPEFNVDVSFAASMGVGDGHVAEALVLNIEEAMIGDRSVKGRVVLRDWLGRYVDDLDARQDWVAQE